MKILLLLLVLLLDTFAVAIVLMVADDADAAGRWHAATLCGFQCVFQRENRTCTQNWMPRVFADAHRGTGSFHLDAVGENNNLKILRKGSLSQAHL